MPKQKKAKAELATPTPAPRGKSVVSHERKLLWAAKPDDALDEALRSAMLGSENAVAEVCHENAIADRWQGKNNGMRRMALGNVLRGKLRRGEPVVVCGQPISA